MGQVASNRVALVPVHAAFALFHVYGIARQVPVDQPMAPRVKVEPFLSDRSACQHERAERAVE